MATRGDLQPFRQTAALPLTAPRRASQASTLTPRPSANTKKIQQNNKIHRILQPLLAEHPNASSERGGRPVAKLGIVPSHLHPRRGVHQASAMRVGESSALTGTGSRFVGSYCRTPPPIVLLIRGRTAHPGTARKAPARGGD